jgi:cytoskeleton protein RodZ
MSEQDQVSESDVLPNVSIMLVEARTAMGLTQKDVADQLFLTPTFIRHMDEGQFHLISKTAYIKGYLRTYARVVGISGDEVVASYEETIQARVEPFEMRDVAEEPVSANRFTGPVIQTGLIGLGALLLVLLLVWLFSGDDEADARSANVKNALETFDDSNNVANDAVVAPTRPLLLPERADVDNSDIDADALVVASASLGNLSLSNALSNNALPKNRGVAVTNASLQADEGRASPVEKKDIESRSLVNEETAVSAAATPLVATADGVASSVVEKPAVVLTVEKLGQGRGSLITVTATGDDKLEFSFSDECWVEVTDADGESIYGDLNRSGDSLVVYGTAPFEVLFGKAPAAQVAFNGEPFALNRYISADLTAKVKLGR